MQARKHARGTDVTYEKLPSRNLPPVRRLILLAVQRGKHGRGHERSGPNHTRRPHEPLSRQARKRVSQNLRRQGQQNLIRDSRILVIKVRLLDNNLKPGKKRVHRVSLS